MNRAELVRAAERAATLEEREEYLAEIALIDQLPQDEPEAEQAPANVHEITTGEPVKANPKQEARDLLDKLVYWYSGQKDPVYGHIETGEIFKHSQLMKKIECLGYGLSTGGYLSADKTQDFARHAPLEVQGRACVPTPARIVKHDGELYFNIYQKPEIAPQPDKRLSALCDKVFDVLAVNFKPEQLEAYFTDLNIVMQKGALLARAWCFRSKEEGTGKSFAAGVLARAAVGEVNFSSKLNLRSKFLPSVPALIHFMDEKQPILNGSVEGSRTKNMITESDYSGEVKFAGEVSIPNYGFLLFTTNPPPITTAETSRLMLLNAAGIDLNKEQRATLKALAQRLSLNEDDRQSFRRWLADRFPIEAFFPDGNFYERAKHSPYWQHFKGELMKPDDHPEAAILRDILVHMKEKGATNTVTVLGKNYLCLRDVQAFVRANLISYEGQPIDWLFATRSEYAKEKRTALRLNGFSEQRKYNNGLTLYEIK